jgi:L-aspartate oxidase
MKTDFLVIGSGIAGLSFALEAAEHGDVVVATKREAVESNTRYAQGGIAGAMGKDDSFDLHREDTLRAGAGLCDEAVVDMCVRSAPARIGWLVDQGVSFSRMPKDESVEFDFGREGGHSRRRVLHVEDLTGQEIERVLLEKVRAHSRIRIMEDHLGLDMVVARAADGGRVAGAFLMDRVSGGVKHVAARATVLATGGAGKVYLYTSNPDVATGDGVAMAYRCGAKVANMEFFQFHPTCLYHPKAKSFLLSEALRGEGGVLRRMDGTRFMPEYHKEAELAPRDIVARAIDNEMKSTGDDHVMLDMTGLDASFLEERFPHLLATCKRFGVDMRIEPVPVVPAAHYMCGGVWTDLDGRTSMPGLYAIGEVACTGLHGANRLASNSLLEALVFSNRAVTHAVAGLPGIDVPTGAEPPLWMRDGAPSSREESVMVTQDWDEIRRLMWNYVGIVRSNRRLTGARRRLDVLHEEVREYLLASPLTPDVAELRNLSLVARLIVESALRRQETRGLHFNVDYPGTDDVGFRRSTILWAGARTSTAS